MRTGSHINALFNGNQCAEYTWYALGDTLPFTSMDASAAARRIVQATIQRDAELTLTAPLSQPTCNPASAARARRR